MEDPLFFASAYEFGDWLEAHHQKLTEQWIGFYKVKSGRPSMSWSESVDQALCFGWIDGIRKSIDEESYKIRFTPRKQKSHWSVVNLEKMKHLLAENLVSPAGIEIYEKRDRNNTKKASFEQKNIKLKKEYEEELKQNEVAYTFYLSLPPSIKKPTIWWVMSAKQESTRQRRLKVLIESAENGERIPQLRWSKKK